MIWHDMVWYETVWRGVAWLDLTWLGLTWLDLAGLLSRNDRHVTAVQPPALKQTYHSALHRGRGWTPPGEEPAYEAGTVATVSAFDSARELPLTHPAVVAGTPELGPNVWPAELPGFQNVQTSLSSGLVVTGLRFLRVAFSSRM